MYSSVLWAGAHLPLPKIDQNKPEASKTWTPLFATRGEMPLFWWLLLDNYNCFWLNNGDPIFIVDRTIALARADARFTTMKEICFPRQADAWQEFRESLGTCSGQILNIQLPKLWRQRFLANVEHFNTYVKNFITPLDGAMHGTRAQKAQHKSMIMEMLASIGCEAVDLRGESLHKTQHC